MLTPSAVANAKPRAAAYKLTDGRGMYLLGRPDGPPDANPLDLPRPTIQTA